MSQITRLAKVIAGISKNQALDLNELVVDSITLGGTAGTNLSKTQLDTLLAQTHAPLSDNQNVIAGAGLTGGGSTASVTLNVVAGDNSLTVAADSVIVKRDVTGAVGIGVDGVLINVDDSTIEKNTNALRVKDLGITTAKIADNAVDVLKLRSDAVIDANRPVTANHIRDTAITPAKLDASIAGSGLAGGAGSPLSVNVDGSTLETTVDTLNVKAGGITGTQLAASVAGAGLTGGAGSPLAVGAGNGIQVDADAIQVLHSPLTKITVTVGESFSADISYFVRWAVSGETAERVYKATAATASNHKYLAFGMLLSNTALTAGQTATVILSGSSTLGGGDTPFAGTDIGKELFLKNDGSGGFSLSAPSTVGHAQYRVGVVQATNKLLIDLKQLASVVPEPLYDERFLYPAGLVSGTDITLPVNSRNGGAAQTYAASEGRLKVFMNQQFKFQGIDWTSGTSPTTQIKFNYALPNDAEVHFRIEPLASGVLTGGGGGGGGGNLQDAYDAGSVINVLSGVPITINGPVSQKLLVINGDIEVTGIIDPTAVQLTGQASNPLGSGQMGIWVDNSGNLMHEDGANPALNISQVITEVQEGTAFTALCRDFINNTGSLIPAFTPVYCPSAGHIAPADGTDVERFRVIGVTTSAIANTASGPVAMNGTIEGVSGYTHNRYLYIGLAAGSKTDVAPTLGGYPSGFQVVKLGIMEGTNLHMQLQHIGTL